MSRKFFIHEGIRCDDKEELAEMMRRFPTEAEAKLWDKLRKFQTFPFDTQVILCGFIADFYCHKVRLAVEIDGEVHARQTAYDKRRSKIILDTSAVTTIRFHNDSVLLSRTSVLKKIRAKCEALVQEQIMTAHRAACAQRLAQMQATRALPVGRNN